MINFDFLKRQGIEKIKESKSRILGNTKQEKKQNSSWDKVKLGFAKYITKILTEYGTLENTYVKRSSLKEDQRAEMEANRWKFRMSPVESGGPTKEQMNEAVLKVVEQFRQREAKPEKQTRVFEMGYESTIQKDEEIANNSGEKEFKIFDSLKTGVPSQLTKKIEYEMKAAGITDEELYKLPIGKLWELFQQKVLEKEIKEPKQEKVYTPEQITEDFSILLNMWKEAYEKMENVSSDKRTHEIMTLTADQFYNPEPLEKYINDNPRLEPEVKFFIEMSIQVKKFRHKAEELLGDHKEKEAQNAA